MKLKVIHLESPGPVVRRFPHLKTDIQEMVAGDNSFRQLCKDYEDLVRTLERAGKYRSDTRADLLSLKTSLEVEILEQVSRKGILHQRLNHTWRKQ